MRVDIISLLIGVTAVAIGVAAIVLRNRIADWQNRTVVQTWSPLTPARVAAGAALVVVLGLLFIGSAFV
jgi:hypothetical protein